MLRDSQAVRLCIFSVERAEAEGTAGTERSPDLLQAYQRQGESGVTSRPSKVELHFQNLSDIIEAGE